MENLTPKPTGSSAVNQYKGVRMRKWGKWVTEVRLPNSRERIWLGSYDTAEKAARAYDAASYCLRGTQAVVNFPADPPNIPSPGRLMTRYEIRAAASRHAHEAPRAGPVADAGPSNARQEAEDVVAQITSMPQELFSPPIYYDLSAGTTGDDHGGPGREHDDDGDVCGSSFLWSFD